MNGTRLAFRGIRRFRKVAQRLGRRIRGTAHLPSDNPDHIWSIGIYSGSSPLNLVPARGVRNPVITGASVNDVSAGFAADPFMVHSHGTWYLFFEIWNLLTKKGELALAKSSDGIHWDYNQVVLAESFHLSYPYVFEWRGDYFMVPETRRAGEVRLYRALEFPTKWVVESVLLRGEDFADSSIFWFRDHWWMFTENSLLKHDTLRLFHANRLEGPWQEHPASPIVAQDPQFARPGGRVVLWQGQLLRFTQNCRSYYGRSLGAFAIKELTTSTYQEESLRPVLLSGSGRGWNRCGMHHIDPHQVGNGRWLACVDGWYDNNDPTWR